MKRPKLWGLDTGEGLAFGANDGAPTVSRPQAANGRRANDLDGSTWTRYSISVWSDIRKTPEELRLNHPAMFPSSLVERLIECFTSSEDEHVLDPFLGSGSTIVAAHRHRKLATGLEVSAEYIDLAKKRLAQEGLFTERRDPRIIQADARDLARHVSSNSVDFCVTSPPYWNILSQRRTADCKAVRDYGDAVEDLGKIDDYREFLEQLGVVFDRVLEVMRPGKYCVVNVMDLRKKDAFFSYHADLAKRMTDGGWIYDDVILWDRRLEYNNLRPLGYPFVFRVNKIHEYLLIFRKPKRPS